MAYPKAIEHYPKSMQIFIKIVHNRIDSGKNCLIPFTGQTGSGKSLSTMSLMIGLYLYRHGKMPEVDYMVNRMKFKALDIMKEFNREDLEKKESWGWDEAGVDAGHKTHASLQNRVVSWLIQTFRNLQQVVFFTVPSMSFLDKTIRKMLHLSIETKTIDKSKKMCICKPLMLQYNERQDKIYYHNLNYPGENNEYQVVDLMAIPIPPPEFVAGYEKIKNSFTQELNRQIQITLEKIESKQGTTLTSRQTQVKELLDKGITSGNEIAELIGVSAPAVSQFRKILRAKGVEIAK